MYGNFACLVCSMTQDDIEEKPYVTHVFQDTIVERTCCHVYAKCYGDDGLRGDPGTLGKKVRIPGGGRR